jgi:low affinity Fe/Cu permease
MPRPSPASNSNGRTPWFTRFARWISFHTGRPSAFLIAFTLIILWAATGPLFHYSDTWQLVINTTTTIVTFLMVFLIQATQNRDTQALQLKLDELIRAMKGARNTLLNIESLSDEEIEQLQTHFTQLAEKAKHQPVTAPMDPAGQSGTR